MNTISDEDSSLDSEDDCRSGSRNVSNQQQQSFEGLPSPERSRQTNIIFVVIVVNIYNFASSSPGTNILSLSLSQTQVQEKGKYIFFVRRKTNNYKIIIIIRSM